MDANERACVPAACGRVVSGGLAPSLSCTFYDPLDAVLWSCQVELAAVAAGLIDDSVEVLSSLHTEAEGAAYVASAVNKAFGSTLLPLPTDAGAVDEM